MIESSIPKQAGEVVKVRELLVIKENPFILCDLVDIVDGEETYYLAVAKGDIEAVKTQVILRIKYEDQENYNVVVNRESQTLAVIYRDYLQVFKVSSGKNEPLF